VKFTIITVVKNKKEELVNTIRSVLSQKYQNFEYIVFDGCSTDGTKEFVNKNYKGRFKYIYKKDKNLYDALNCSIALSNGDYIGILHAGDFFYSDSLLSLINKKLNKNYDFIFGDLIYYNSNFNVPRILRSKVNSLNKFNFFKIPHPTVFFNKKFFLRKKLYYNIKYDISSDMDFIIRLVNESPNYLYVKKFFIFMKIGGLSTSFNKFLQKFFEDFEIYIKHFGFFSFFIFIRKTFFKVKGFFFYKKRFIQILKKQFLKISNE